MKLFPTEVHAASCQEILEKTLDLKSETGFVYSNGESEYKVAIEDINQKGFKYFKIDASDFDNFAKIGLTPYPSGLFPQVSMVHDSWFLRRICHMGNNLNG